MALTGFLENVPFLQNVLIALALGVLVGMERERVPEKKYAGVRTLSIFCAGGPISVLLTELSGSVLPVAIYLSLGAVFSLLVIGIRIRKNPDDLGLTTSSTVFLMALVGTLVGYEYHFEAVSVTLIAVFLLTEKDFFTRYTDRLTATEISDAVKLGILALVLYPILPEGAVDTYGMLHLRKALLFVIFILLIQFGAFVSLAYFRTQLSFIVSAALGGVVSSLAVVTTMAQFVKDEKINGSAYIASVAAVVAMVVRNGFIAVVLALPLLPYLAAPFLTATVIGLIFALFYYHGTNQPSDVDFGEESPFSFASAFEFGVFFLVILMLSKVAQGQLSDLGIYATAFLGGIGSSTAVVASAVTLFESSTTVTAQEAATMVSLGAVSSLLSKLVYVRLGGAPQMMWKLLLPYGLMALALLSIFL